MGTPGFIKVIGQKKYLSVLGHENMSAVTVGVRQHYEPLGYIPNTVRILLPQSRYRRRVDKGGILPAEGDSLPVDIPRTRDKLSRARPQIQHGSVIAGDHFLVVDLQALGLTSGIPPRQVTLRALPDYAFARDLRENRERSITLEVTISKRAH